MVKFFDKYILLLLLISIIPAWSLSAPGFYGASDEVHIAWLYEMDRALQSQFPPRLAPDLSYGFGYPLFNFIFPLPYYIGEVFHKIGFSFVDSLKLIFFISIPFSALSMYFLLRRFSEEKLSLLGAILYIFAPYRSVDLYVRGALGEIVAFMFFPMILLTTVNLTQENQKKVNWKWLGIGGISVALLVLSHNIATYMFLPFALLLAAIRIFFMKNGKWLSAVQTVGVFFLGLLGSVYFWLPALLESGLMKYDTVFNFIDHFPTLKQLFLPYWGYGASVAGPYDGMSFFLGISSVVVLILGTLLTLIFWKKYNTEQKTVLSWVIFSLLIVFFMMNFRSTIAWDNLPLLPYFQFPWRFLMMTTLFIPVLVITLERLKFNKWIVLSLIVLTIGINYSYFRPQDFLGRTDGYFLNKYIPFPSASEEYNKNQEEYLRLPKDTLVRPDKVYSIFFDQDGNKILEANQKSATEFMAESSFNRETYVNVSKYYFPGWKASVDGKDVEIKAGSPFSQISMMVPSGTHTLRVHFVETINKLLLDIVSVMSFGVLLFLVFRSKLRKNEN